MIAQSPREQAAAALALAPRRDAVALGRWATELAAELGNVKRIEASAGGRWSDPEVTIDFHEPAQANAAAELLGMKARKGTVANVARFEGRVDGVHLITWGVMASGNERMSAVAS